MQLLLLNETIEKECTKEEEDDVESFAKSIRGKRENRLEFIGAAVYTISAYSSSTLWSFIKYCASKLKTVFSFSSICFAKLFT